MEALRRTRVLCFGDSNTWGYIAEGPDGGYVLRHPWGVRWPSVASDALGENYEVIEDGCNGRTTGFPDPKAEGRNGLEYLKENLSKLMPVDIAIVALGINDVKPDICGDTAASRRAMEAILEELKAAGITRILLILPPRLERGIFGPPFAADFGLAGINALVEELRETYRNLAVARQLRLLDAAEFACAGRDGLHLTAESHVSLGCAVADAIARWSQRTPT